MPHGDYALYVGCAYGISAVVLVALIADSLIRARGWKRKGQSQGKDRPRP